MGWGLNMPRLSDRDDLLAGGERQGDLLQRRPTSPGELAHAPDAVHPFLSLQRQVGNRAVVQLAEAAGARREDDDAAEAEAPDWSAPIEQEDEQRGESQRCETGTRQGAGAPVVQRQHTPPTVFPTFPQIRWNTTVTNAMWAAWAETLRATTRTSRREQGFWVQWDSTTTRNANGDMRTTGAVTGPAVGPAVGAAVTLGAVPADAGDWVTVGSFHTHTPTRHRTVGRVVGPSGADNTADTNDNVVGLVYDYTAVRGGAVPARHPIWSAAQVYHSGPNRRV